MMLRFRVVVALHEIELEVRQREVVFGGLVVDLSRSAESARRLLGGFIARRVRRRGVAAVAVLSSGDGGERAS